MFAEVLLNLGFTNVDEFLGNGDTVITEGVFHPIKDSVCRDVL